MKKKKVIAYLHTHWDREWYREFEVFRLRLLRVFDNVINLLKEDKIPSFYFDGQVSALLDYLELRPENKALVKKLISEKRLFIGPCFTLIDEFLTDRTNFRKNLEIGLKISRDFGCEDFIGYFADTFGHSQNVPLILKEFGIDKCVVWRGCDEKIPSEFMFNGVKCAYLLRGYFNDFFSCKCSVEKKSELLKNHLDKIAKKSGNVLFMPIGADHLGVETDIKEQISQINSRLNDYEIILSSPFEYFKLVDKNFDKFQWNDELRNNSETFILPGCYSAHTLIKKYNTECSFKLSLADDFQKYCRKNFNTKSYDNVIEYAYKLLLQNEAHDGICGCSTDEVHNENITRYKKILQISNTIIEELKFLIKKDFCFYPDNIKGFTTFESEKKLAKEKFQLLSVRKGFENSILYDTQRIPITEDYRNIYTYLTEIGQNKAFDLNCNDNLIENSKIKLSINNGKLNIFDKTNNKLYKDIIKITDDKDCGNTYNFAPKKGQKTKFAEIISANLLYSGIYQCAILLKFKLGREKLNIKISLNKGSEILNFEINWNNLRKNHLLQVLFKNIGTVKETYSEDMNTLICRKFDENYNIKNNFPKTKGSEANTNTAPMQRYLNVNDLSIITKGITEYEVKKEAVAITILRATGLISNPKNTCRTTPAGPPIEVETAQQLGENVAEFSILFGNSGDWNNKINRVYNKVIFSNY